MSPTFHFEADLGASNPQNHQKILCFLYVFAMSATQHSWCILDSKRPQNRANSCQDDPKMTPRRAKLELKHPSSDPVSLQSQPKTLKCEPIGPQVSPKTPKVSSKSPSASKKHQKTTKHINKNTKHRQSNIFYKLSKHIQ